MGGSRGGRVFGEIVVAVFAGLLVLAMADTAPAQTAAGGAEIKQMTGRVELRRSRQSNFVSSTPTAVAAARGTHYEVTYDVTQKVTRVAVLPDPRFPEAADADHDNAYAFNQKTGDRF